MAIGKKDKFPNCYRLDSGGIIYPYIAKSDRNQVFRLEAELDEDIDFTFNDIDLLNEFGEPIVE